MCGCVWGGGGGGDSNSETLILKDSSVRSIWPYLTASPCYSTNMGQVSRTIPETDSIKYEYAID